MVVQGHPGETKEEAKPYSKRQVWLPRVANLLTALSLLTLLIVLISRYLRELEWTLTTSAVALASIMFVSSVLIFGYLRVLEWTGLTGPLDKFQMRTLWDWLQLLFVPAVLGLGGLWFATALEQQQADLASRREKQQQELADKRQDAAAEAEEQRRQDTLLLSYLDQMSQSLTNEGIRKTNAEDPPGFVDEVASARTITVLRSLDAEHKRMVVRFAYEAELIPGDNPFLEIDGANLNDADLGYMPLNESDLSNTFLANADLHHADLSEAVLHGADLSGANLGHADLSGANLQEADLRGADLGGARLVGTDLSGANLDGTKVSPDQLDNCKSLHMSTGATSGTLTRGT